MATSNYRVNIIVATKDEGTTSTLGKITGAMGDIAKIATGNVLASGFTSLAGAVSGAMGAIVSSLGGAAQTGLQFNQTMENVKAQLMAFTKDGGKASDILEMIRVRAAKTPFEFDEMAKAAAGLLPAAKQSGMALEDLIAKAEILAASNPAQGLEGAAFALREALSGDFTSIIERFNLPRSELNKLKNVGKEITRDDGDSAKAYNAAMKDVTKVTLEGSAAFDAVSKVMEKMGLDTSLVANLAETAGGRWSTFSDILTNLAGMITQPLFQLWSDGLREVNAFLTANEPLLNMLAEQIGGVLSIAANNLYFLLTQKILPGLQGILNGIAPVGGMFSWLEPIIWGVNAVLFKLADWIFMTGIPALTGFISTITQAYSQSGITGVVGAILAELQGAWPGIQAELTLWAGSFWEWMTGTVVPGTTGVFGGLVTTITTFLTANWPTISGALNQWATMFYDWIVAPGGVLEKTGDFMSKVTGKISEWANSPAGAGKLQELGGVLAKALIGGIELGATNSESIAIALGKLAQTLATLAIQSALAFREVGTKIAMGVIDGLVEYFTGAKVSSELKGALEGAVRGALTAVAPAAAVGDVGRAMGIPGFATGGIVPGAIGAPRLATVHGGETIVPPGRSTTNYFNLTVNSNAGAEGVIGNFRTLQALAG